MHYRKSNGKQKRLLASEAIEYALINMCKGKFKMRCRWAWQILTAKWAEADRK